MPRFDLTPAELESYRPDIREPDDFDAFWTDTIAASRAIGGDVVVTPVVTPLTEIDVFDVTFPGFGGDPVKAWLWTPRGATGPLPTVVEYNGYGGGRGLPHERLTWAAAGYAHLFMDTRGQGSVWGSGGETPDPHGTGPSVPGFMTRGIEDPADYYYRRVFTDGVRAVDAVRGLHDRRPHTRGRDRRQPGRRHRDRGRRPCRRPRRGDAGCAVPLPLRAGDRHDRP